MANVNMPASAGAPAELPPPISQPEVKQQDSAGTVEQTPLPTSAEKAVSPEAAALPIMPPASQPQASVQVPLANPLAMAAGQNNDDSSTTLSSNVTGVDESDLIEKEWVNKAKQIVERTRDDPYKQSEELTLVKADYLKKHYNKTLKLNK